MAVFLCGEVWGQTTETPTASVEVIVDLPIPDGDAIHGVSSTIRIPGAGSLRWLEVALVIEHPAIEQLRITLTNPVGITSVLHNRGASDLTPFAPIYESRNPAAESLSRFIGHSAQGDWILRVYDVVEGATGVIRAWGLRYRPVELSIPPPPTPLPLPPEVFLERARFTLDGEILGVHRADFDGDGLDDIAALKSDSVRIFYSDGERFLRSPLIVEAASPQLMATGDLNGNGAPDFVTASQASGSSMATVTVYLSNEAGGYDRGFEAQASIITPLETLVLVDVNGNGILDLIVGGVPKLFTGIGDGSFQLEGDLFSLSRRLIAYNDLTGDGAPELLALRGRGGTSVNTDPYLLFASSDLTFENRLRLSIDDRLDAAFPASPIMPQEPRLAAISLDEEGWATRMYTIGLRPGRVLTVDETEIGRAHV